MSFPPYDFTHGEHQPARSLCVIRASPVFPVSFSFLEHEITCGRFVPLPASQYIPTEQPLPAIMSLSG